MMNRTFLTLAVLVAAVVASVLLFGGYGLIVVGSALVVLIADSTPNDHTERVND